MGHPAQKPYAAYNLFMSDESLLETNGGKKTWSEIYKENLAKVVLYMLSDRREDWWKAYSGVADAFAPRNPLNQFKIYSGINRVYLYSTTLMRAIDGDCRYPYYIPANAAATCRLVPGNNAKPQGVLFTSKVPFWKRRDLDFYYDNDKVRILEYSGPVGKTLVCPLKYLEGVKAVRKSLIRSLTEQGNAVYVDPRELVVVYKDVEHRFDPNYFKDVAFVKYFNVYHIDDLVPKDGAEEADKSHEYVNQWIKEDPYYKQINTLRKYVREYGIATLIVKTLGENGARIEESPIAIGVEYDAQQHRLMLPSSLFPIDRREYDAQCVRAGVAAIANTQLDAKRRPKHDDEEGMKAFTLSQEMAACFLMAEVQLDFFDQWQHNPIVSWVKSLEEDEQKKVIFQSTRLAADLTERLKDQLLVYAAKIQKEQAVKVAKGNKAIYQPVQPQQYGLSL